MSRPALRNADDSAEPAFGTANPLTALTPARERLTTTLFLAALFHGVLILGITFSTPTSFSGAPSLEVLLLVDDKSNEELNPEAAYLAQRNQKGSGTTEAAVKPTSPMASLLPTYLAGIADGNGVTWQEARTGNPSIDVVASQSRTKAPSMQHGAREPSREAETPLALFYALPAPVIATSADKALTLRGKITKEVEVAPNTRETKVAPYLDGWKRKVEKLGTLKYPMAARQRELSGNPVLEVVIRSDGTLSQIVVRRSSGHAALDQAAIGILKLASPFDPFPPNLQQDFDQLRFAYEWRFIGERMVGSVKLDN